EVEILDLELEPAFDPPARADMVGEVAVEIAGELLAEPARLDWLLRARQREQTVRVAVEDAVAVPLDPRLRPEKHLAAEARDRVRDVGVMEAAGGCPENAVERVHEDLDRVRGDPVARALGRLAPREEIVEERGQDPGLAAERGAVGRDDGVPALRLIVGRSGDVSQRVD